LPRLKVFELELEDSVELGDFHGFSVTFPGVIGPIGKPYMLYAFRNVSKKNLVTDDEFVLEGSESSIRQRLEP
jgi:hypothetical protein